MGNPFFNHRRCPDCGNHIKHYYWYCGRCGNQDLINWAKTLIMWTIFVIIVTVGALSMRDRLCSSTITAQAVNSVAPAWLSCK